MNKKLFIIPFMALGLAIAAAPAGEPIAVHAEGETVVSLGTALSSNTGGWGMGINLPITTAGVDVGYIPYLGGAGISSYTGINLYDQKGTSIDLDLEPWGNMFAFRRVADAAYVHTGFTLDIASNATITLGGGSVIAFDKAYHYVEETIPDAEGVFWGIRNPASSISFGSLESISVGASVTANVSLAGDNATTFKYFESSDPAVATVDAYTGVITGVSEGTATITAYSGLKSATQTITITPAAAPVDGIVVDPNVITIKQYTDYKLSDVHVYATRGGERAEGITVTADMISGTFNKNVVGEYTLTVTYSGFTTTFKVNVEALPAATLPRGELNYDYGQGTGWIGANFFFFTSGRDIGQYVHINDTNGPDAMADIRSHIEIAGSTANLEHVANMGGPRYEMYFTPGFTLLPGDTIVLKAGLKIYQYSGTVNGNWGTEGDGIFYPVEEFKSDITFIYLGGANYDFFNEKYVATDFTLSAPFEGISVGEEMQLEWALTPSTAVATPKFTSSNEAVATVSPEGKVTGVSVGDVTITATLGSKTQTISFSVAF